MSEGHESETAGGPAEAPELVLTRHRREFVAFVQRRVGDAAVAEDIVQEAFARGLAGLDALDDHESAIAWFYRMLRNAVVDHHRRRGAAARKLDAFARELEVQTEPDASLRGAICTCVSGVAESLKPEYGDALKRIEIDGVPVKDYAVEAGISSSNAAVRVFRARQALKQQVTRVCGACATHGCIDCTCRTPKNAD